MGEYAIHNGQSVKIGTCEQMYYLRADQVHLIQPEPGSVNPRSVKHAEGIRFRFPFPQEDHVRPGGFDSYDYGFGIYGIEPPSDPDSVEHHNLQFTRNYPSQGGILLSVPCPRSKAGKASGLKFSYNGYIGPVHVHSQRLVEGKLVLILRCGDCGALYRVPTLEEARPVLDCLEKDGSDIAKEIAKRIIAGYTEPNFWNPQSQQEAA